MNDPYLNEKVREALASTNGNRHDAQKLLIAWAVKDHQLLLSMTGQHLKAIATALIERVERPAPAEQPPKAQQDAKLTRNNLDPVFANSGGSASHENRRKTNLPPPKSTEAQASAMRLLAEAFAKKREDR